MLQSKAIRAKRFFGILAFLCFLMLKNAFAFSWDFNGDTNLGNPESAEGLIAGLNNVRDPWDEGDEEIGTFQPIQISGAGTLLPSGYSQFTLDFHADMNSWDSYYGPDSFFDVFAAVLSEQDYYWNLSDTSTHPLENNSALLLGYNLFQPAPALIDSYWGGALREEGTLDFRNADARLVFNTDPAKQYYLTMFLQTMEDGDLSSWGTFSNVRVTAAPEPVSIVLFLGGGVVLFGSRRFRKRSLKKA